ncbi:DivIVA domain-containing protein [Rhodococcus sp. HNM0569]|uniref:DivIVA domain-containing protein n=1 Tax=Rhodococcus sp. HNM0569 TaxID=2716340 RepID=UPI001469C2D7|nr:DivIVA domain-containing protein [Rhodococcus sp. HNM0569]NLU83869.1 DivIVA domain-containing protein [Rhodococcus sp. HNM0569]
MITAVLYLLVMVVVGALLFFAASAVFGRSEQAAPLPPGTTATVLPADDVSGEDVRALRFQQVLRGYKASEVDWALDRLAHELDATRLRAERAEDQVRALTRKGES